MDKDTLSIYTLVFASVLAGLVLVGYGLYIINTLQFFTGLIVAFVIGGACIDALFADDFRDQSRRRY